MEISHLVQVVGGGGAINIFGGFYDECPLCRTLKLVPDTFVHYLACKLRKPPNYGRGCVHDS